MKQDEVKKYLVCEGRASVIIARTTNMVEEYRKLKDLTPTTTAVMGRVITMAGLMGHTDMKDNFGNISIIIDGNGPVGKILAVANRKNNNVEVKACIGNSMVELPRKANGKIDVGTAVGNNGLLNVIYGDKDKKAQYTGMTELISGEIAEDFAKYYVESQQKPNVVALGVLVDKNGVKVSGGYKIELMPDATEEDISQIENAIKNAPTITDMLNQGKELNEIIEIITGDENSMTLVDKLNIEYKCDCSKEKFEEIFATLHKDEIKKIIEEDEKAEVCCQFCNKKYIFNKEDLEKLLK